MRKPVGPNFCNMTIAPASRRATCSECLCGSVLPLTNKSDHRDAELANRARIGYHCQPWQPRPPIFNGILAKTIGYEIPRVLSPRSMRMSSRRRSKPRPAGSARLSRTTTRRRFKRYTYALSQLIRSLTTEGCSARSADYVAISRSPCGSSQIELYLASFPLLQILWRRDFSRLRVATGLCRIPRDTADA